MTTGAATDGCCVSPHFTCHVWHVTICNYCSSLSRDASQYVTFVTGCGHASSHFIVLTSNNLFAIYYLLVLHLLNHENALGLKGFIPLIFLWSSGEGQARIDKGWPVRRKASMLKPEPRAYTKVGCHLPTTRKFQYTWLMAWWWPGEASGGKGRCVGSLWVTLGSL